MCEYLAAYEALYGQAAKRRLIGSCLNDNLVWENDANGSDVTLYILGSCCGYVHHSYRVKAQLAGQAGLDNTMSCTGVDHCRCRDRPGTRLPLFLKPPLQGA